MRIKHIFIAGGGHKELADRMVQKICEVIEAGPRPGRPAETVQDRVALLDDIARLQRRNPLIRTKSSIARNLGVDRDKVRRAMEDPKARIIRSDRRSLFFGRRWKKVRSIFDDDKE